jgi:hypothetical protein
LIAGAITSVRLRLPYFSTMLSHALRVPGAATLRCPTKFSLPTVSKMFWPGSRSATGVYMSSVAAIGATA